MDAQDIVQGLGWFVGGGSLVAVLKYLNDRRTVKVSEGRLVLDGMETLIEKLQDRVVTLEADVSAERKLRMALQAEVLELEAEVRRLRAEVNRT